MLLLLISFLGLEARDDPAQLDDRYVTESHESYRPAEAPVTLMAHHHRPDEDKRTGNQKPFSDVISSASSESVEFFVDNRDSIARSGKLTLQSDIDGATTSNVSRRCGSVVDGYLKPGDKVIGRAINNASSRGILSEGGRIIDVTHDVFATTTSLLVGIIYKGEKSSCNVAAVLLS